VGRSNDGGVVLLIGSQRRVYREYLLSGLAGRAPLWLIDEKPVTWQSEYVVGSSAIGMLDPDRFVPDEQGLIDAAAEIGKIRPVLGVCTYDDAYVVATAIVAERLGLPSLTVTGADHCRDKHLTRTALTAAGLLQPRFALVTTLAEAAAEAERIGFPVVLKPRGMGASVGVIKVSGPAELAWAFQIAARAAQTGPPDYELGVLVEEMVHGPEISVDGVVAAGEYQPFCLARKQLGSPPSFEETGHIVDAGDPLAEDAGLRHMLAEAHHVLGLADGITHTEVRLTARGLVINEVNPRLGGGFIPYLGKLATGVDPGEVAADVAMGIPPRLAASRRQVAGVRFLYPPEDCHIAAITLPGLGSVPGLVSAEPLVAVGDAVYLPPRANIGRYAALIACTGDPVSCQASLDQATALSSVQGEPLSPEELDPEKLF
jgi:hypothetical protein